MSHLPYETWILEDEPLNSEQKLALKQHMDTCPQCAKINKNWRQVAQQIKCSPQVAPQPGFSLRWRASLSERRAREQQEQIRKFLKFLLVIGIVGLGSLGGLLVLTSSPINLLVSFAGSIISFLSLTEQIQQMVITFLRIMPPIVPVALWVVITSSLSIFAVVWLVSIWRISTQGVWFK